jgi:multidrug resistance protein, MATE family
MVMEPICGQAYSAGHYGLLNITMQRTMFLLIVGVVLIGVL